MSGSYPLFCKEVAHLLSLIIYNTAKINICTTMPERGKYADLVPFDLISVTRL